MLGRSAHAGEGDQATRRTPADFTPRDFQRPLADIDAEARVLEANHPALAIHADAGVNTSSGQAITHLYDAANSEEQQRRQHIEDADALVIDGRHPAVQYRRDVTRLLQSGFDR